MNDSSINLPVPARGDPDRSRALNVLAQRRYRQRKREKIRTLERQVQSTMIEESSDAQGEGLQASQPYNIASDGYTADIGTDPASCADAVGLWSNSICQSSSCRNNSPPTPPLSGRGDSGTIAIRQGAPIPFGNYLFQNDIDFGNEIQDLECSQFTFSDDAVLQIPEVRFMKATLEIAKILGCEQSIWDLTTSHTLSIDAEPGQPLILPADYEPTPAQKSIPHHPLFDIIPWATVRTRLIHVFAQPVEMRPPSARDPMALLNLAYDMEDSVEGLRVEGENCFDSSNWEIGQKFFQNWWWALDRSIVTQSNALRARRGASRLQLMPAKVSD